MNFLEANTEKKLFTQVTGEQKKKAGLVVQEKSSAFITEPHIAKFWRGRNGSAVKYSHFELKIL